VNFNTGEMAGRPGLRGGLYRISEDGRVWVRAIGVGKDCRTWVRTTGGPRTAGIRNGSWALWRKMRGTVEGCRQNMSDTW